MRHIIPHADTKHIAARGCASRCDADISVASKATNGMLIDDPGGFSKVLIHDDSIVR